MTIPTGTAAPVARKMNLEARRSLGSQQKLVKRSGKCHETWARAENSYEKPKPNQIAVPGRRFIFWLVRL
jgi:hypothetical protein